MAVMHSVYHFSFIPTISCAYKFNIHSTWVQNEERKYMHFILFIFYNESIFILNLSAIYIHNN